MGEEEGGRSGDGRESVVVFFKNRKIRVWRVVSLGMIHARTHRLAPPRPARRPTCSLSSPLPQDVKANKASAQLFVWTSKSSKSLDRFWAQVFCIFLWSELL
jgi:hypothetical protein